MVGRICTNCKLEKPLEDFAIRRAHSSGLNPKCKKCVNTYTSRLYYTNISYRSNRIRQATIRNRKRKYGLSQEAYLNLLVKQDHKCAICKMVLDKSRFGLIGQVDHCHTTGKIRGILCSSCNTGIGNLQEKEEILTAAIEYLKDHNNG